MGLSKETTASLVWVNSAHTWIDISDMEYDKFNGTYTAFTSEGGAVEFFLFNSNKNSNSGNRV